MSREVLKIEGLRIGVKSGAETRELTHGTDLSVRAGEFFALVGESGSGKTVTAQAALGFLPQPGGVRISGRVELDGRDLFALPEEELRKIRGKEVGLVFQEPSSALDPLMRVGRQLKETLLLHGGSEGADERVREMLRAVELPERVLDAWPHELSGGMQQRAVIAMALMHRPSLLVADEPTTALDVTIQAQVLELLAKLRKELDVAVLFVTHNLALVAQRADRLAVMEKGSIVEEGSVEEFFRAPKHPYSRRLLASVPKLPEPGRISVPDAGAEKAGTPERRTILEGRGLRVRFATKFDLLGRPTEWLDAVDGVDVAVGEDHALGLVGESGSGKSTLGQTLLGLRLPSEGEVFADGALFATPAGLAMRSAAKERAFRRRFQIVFQDTASSLNPRSTVFDILARPMLAHGICAKADARRRCAELLDLVELPSDSLGRFPHAFSGGQRQRVAIARALSLRPKLLVCDEIVSALDVTIQAQILGLLKRLRKEFRLSLLFIAHDLAVVHEVCDDVAVMKSGRIVERGPCAEVFARPSDPYTKKLLAAVPRIGAE